MTAATLLIVDDHPVFAGGFSHMVRALRPEWTLHAAGSATQALTELRNLSPDLTIIDVRLPDDDGFNLLRIIADTWPKLPSVLISGSDDVTVRTRARASGAAGFIAKTASPETIVDMLDTVLGGGLAFPDSERPNNLPVLTPRQAEVLALLAAGLGNKEIRHQLGIAERTVRAHLTELFHLLGVHSRMQAVIRGRELGLIER
ncbi:MAG: response regulator transcription factor [Rhizobiales bacterium]|nr:response regulator transcription factor [Hyphomicrobiales bacterium]